MSFDIGQNLRMRRIFESLFNPPNKIGAATPAPAPMLTAPATESPLNPPDASSDLRSLRLRATPDINAYKDYLRSAPDPKDYQQGKIGKILSAVAGFTEGVQKGPVAGVTTARSLMRRPYDEAVETYKAKEGRLKDLAQLEYTGLTDDQKLAVQIANDELGQRKEIREWLKTKKDMSLTDAQIENIQSQVKNRGLSIQPNNETGELEVVDIAKGTRQSLGKFADSLDEASKRDFELFKKKQGVEQAGRVSLEDLRAKHAKELEELRQSGDEELAKVKRNWKLQDDDLKGMTPSQQKSAMELAYSQTVIDNPGLDTTSEEFTNGIRQRLKEIRERATIPGKPTITEPHVTLPDSTISANPNEVDVVSPSGVEGTIPASQLQEALAAGYRRK